MALQPLARVPKALGNTMPGLACLGPPLASDPGQLGSKADTCTGSEGKWEPQTITETEVRPRDKNALSGESSDNRTTKAETTAISALHVACGFVCAFLTVSGHGFRSH